MTRDFWKSAGLHLLSPDSANRLAVSADFLRAYFTRPEVHPIEESCAVEHAIFEQLMADPFASVSAARIAEIADPDAQLNYRVVLGFRDHLARHKTLEAAYLAFFDGRAITVPPVFIDQMVHVLLRHILRDSDDPIRLRAGELFFREQNVSVDEGRILLADREIVEMYAKTGGAGGLGQLLVGSNTPMKPVEMDVLDEDNKALYWERSDKFDTVIDFRFTQPALDAFARVIEAWIAHFHSVVVRVQPKQRIDDEEWRWHIGLDSAGTQILNALYEDKGVDDADLNRIIGLFQLDFDNLDEVTRDLRGSPVYLGLAMTDRKTLKMKPQNLLVNLPLAQKA